MNRNAALSLRDILDNMRLAEDFVCDMTPEGFSADRKTAYAVLRCPEIIGEAAKNVPESIREAHSAIHGRHERSGHSLLLRCQLRQGVAHGCDGHPDHSTPG